MPKLDPQVRAVSYITMLSRNHRWNKNPASRPRPKNARGDVITVPIPAIPAAVSSLTMPIPSEVDIAAIAASKSISAQDVAILLDTMVAALTASLTE